MRKSYEGVPSATELSDVLIFVSSYSKFMEFKSSTKKKPYYERT